MGAPTCPEVTTMPTPPPTTPYPTPAPTTPYPTPPPTTPYPTTPPADQPCNQYFYNYVPTPATGQVPTNSATLAPASASDAVRFAVIDIVFAVVVLSALFAT